MCRYAGFVLEEEKLFEYFYIQICAMLDQIVSESYRIFLSSKSRCESIQSVSNFLRSKRETWDQNFGASSGSGSDCCPPVVDPLLVMALLGFIAAATYFLQSLITMNLMGRRKKRSIRSRRPEHSLNFINLGTKILPLHLKLLFEMTK